MNPLLVSVLLVGLSDVASSRPRVSERELRAQAIEATLRGLEAERDRNGGDWSRWHESLAPFRASLRARIAAAKTRYAEVPHAPSVRGPLLEPLGDPPLFLCIFFSEMGHLGPDAGIEPWIARRPALETVPAVSAWLRRKGIDLIFVPVPVMGDVYPELIAENAPANRLVAPAMRRVVHELAQRGVEVFDPLPVLLDTRARGRKPLYQPADPHWAPRGQHAAAEALAKVLERYPFVARSRALPPRYKVVRQDRWPSGVAYDALSVAQKARIEPILSAGMPVAQAGASPLTADEAPVLVIGDSFALGFQDFLAANINQPVFSMAAGGQVTQGVIDLARDPSLLAGRRVVVWISNMGTLGPVDERRWRIPPLP